MENCLDHLCILVKNVEDVRRYFINKQIKVGEIIINESEKRFYVDGGKERAKLLFVQVLGEGSFNDSLEKHGFGIHHAGIVVKNIRKFLGDIKSKGWYLNTISIDTYEEKKKVWLTRPGYPILLEVFEDKEKHKRLNVMESFIEGVFLPDTCHDKSLMEILGTKELQIANLCESKLKIGDDFYSVRDFYDEIV